MTLVAGLNDARNFIARVIALPEDGDGYIGLHNTFIPKGFKTGKLPFGQGLLAADADDAVSKIPRLFKGNNRDIYVCMGTQKHHKETPDRKTGELRYVPDKRRDNIFKLKSLFLDVDFKGGDHGYVSQADADVALAKFIADSGLPAPSVVVHTGGGYHIYWVLIKPLATAEWQVLANELEEATRVHGFKHDGNVTVDCSRVLRIPNTMNYKYDPPRSVKIHEWTDHDYDPDELAKALSPYQTTKTQPRVIIGPEWELFKGVKPFQGFQSKEEITELGDGCTISPPIDLKHVHQQCGFIRETIRTEGVNLQGNTLWNLTTLMATFTLQGRAAAHLMSKGNQYYNADQTDKLYDRKLLEKERGVGWPKCSTIEASGATECALCPHRAKGLYPFSFLTSPAPAVATYTTLPPDGSGSGAGEPPMVMGDILPNGYIRDAGRFIYKIRTDKEGNNYEVYPTRTSILSDAYLSLDPATLHFKTQPSQFLPAKAVTMPLRAVTSANQEMTNILGDAAITFDDRKDMGEFLMAWVDKLREARETHTDYPAFGWAEDAGKVIGFSYSGKMYSPSGVRLAKGADPELEKDYHSRGDIEEWKKAARMVTNTKRPAMDAVLAAAFAAPLVYFTGEEGLFFGVYSEDSGLGKTTTMRIAQSVWSVPSAMQRLTDTIASVQHKMGQLRHLPIMWDELKGDENLRDMAKMIFALTSGKSRSRLTTDIKLREAGAWKTLLVTASNNSLSDYINEYAKNNDAGFYRLFELKVDKMNTGKVHLADAALLKTRLEANCGAVGAVYAEYLGRRFDHIHKLIEDLQRKLEKELNIAQAERNWLNVMVVLMVGAAIANTLGLTEIDIPALKAKLAEEIEAMRATLVETPLKFSEREEIVATFAQYLRENARKMIVTNTMWARPGKPPPGSVVVVHPMTNLPLDGIIGQYAEDTNTLRLAKKPLDMWLLHKKIPLNTFIKLLKLYFTVQHKNKGALGAGCPGIGSLQETVLDFDCSGSDELGGFISTAIRTNNVVPMQAVKSP